MLIIDGSLGDGGGQVLRTALALSLATGRAFRIENVRAGRQKPGLMRRHLTAIKAAAEVGRAEVEGAEIAAREITFAPGEVTGGDYHFAVGAAGGTALVLQTVLPALITAPNPSAITIEGGTHTIGAPPADFVQKSFLPFVNRMGPTVTVEVERPGFYPASGGRLNVSVQPADDLKPFQLLQRGPIRARRAHAVVAMLSPDIGHRELAVVAKELGWDEDEQEMEMVRSSSGPGNVVMLHLEMDTHTEVFTGFGARVIPAERAAKQAVKQCQAYLSADAPVGVHLADQLLVLLAVAGAGRFRTLPPSPHTETAAHVIGRFLGLDVILTEDPPGAWRVDVQGK